MPRHLISDGHGQIMEGDFHCPYLSLETIQPSYNKLFGQKDVTKIVRRSWMLKTLVNPSNAAATFIQRTRTQRFLKTL